MSQPQLKFPFCNDNCSYLFLVLFEIPLHLQYIQYKSIYFESCSIQEWMQFAGLIITCDENKNGFQITFDYLWMLSNEKKKLKSAQILQQVHLQ